ncbi:MAG TPA: single-stranded DNA-binding protein [Opitutaceae bacterium]|jgi:single-strand DNA-binding protein
MPYLNRYSFVGNLTKAPELRLPASEGRRALCLLNVAINRDIRGENGEKRTFTTFVNDIEVWGPNGEACAHHLTSGSLVLVEGRMDVDQWVDKLTGARRMRMKVVADNVQFLRIRRPEDPPVSPPAAAPVIEAAEAPVDAKPASRARRPARAGT